MKNKIYSYCAKIVSIAFVLVFIQFLLLVDKKYLLANDKEFEYNLEFTTEPENKFGGKFDLLNLLSLDLSIPTEKLGLWKNGNIDILSFATYKLQKERIYDDLQGFSNIETDENTPFGFSLLGYTHSFDEKFSIFAGLRRINVDYFDSDNTSFFTNSSIVAFPTAASNFYAPIDPFSAMCLHFEYQTTENLLLEISFYNGVAYFPYDDFKKNFTVAPKQDGVLTIGEINYSKNLLGIGNNALYCLGACGLPFYEKNKNFSIWARLEQNIFNFNEREVQFFLFYSFGKIDEQAEVIDNFLCAKNYYGTGFIVKNLFTKEDGLGAYYHFAEYRTNKEGALEISYKYNVVSWLTLQPTIHIIKTANEKTVGIGMVRATFSFSN